MTATATLRPIVGPTGLTLWRLPGSALSIMWAGPGSRLLIGWCETPGGAVTHIEHPAADGAYMTRREAQAAVAAFMAAAS